MATHYANTKGSSFTVYSETERNEFWRGMGAIESNLGRVWITKKGNSYKLLSTDKVKNTEIYTSKGVKKSFKLDKFGMWNQSKIETWADGL